MNQIILPPDFLDTILKNTASILWSYLEPLWPIWSILLVILICGITLQIIMIKQGGPQNRLPSGFNRFAGSTLRLIFMVAIFLIFAHFLQFGVFGDVVFVVIEALAYFLTGLFYRAIGFWTY